MSENKDNSALLPHLFRQEYSKMTAVLCRHFGLRHIELAEDIASETFLKATEHWVSHGIPENPAAWLYTVAKNKAKDYLRRQSVFESKIKPSAEAASPLNDHSFEFSSDIIADSQLAMIFAVCNPLNSAEAQICLALQILCGFSIEEIANAFLSKSETIKKRLLRARARLRDDNFRLNHLSENEIRARQEIVLKTLYLLFNEGYFSKSDSLFIRKDLCAEAMRLCLMLTENTLTNTAEANALLALMCFQSSRLNARTDAEGRAVLFDEQDKNQWDHFLINKGNYYMTKAFTMKNISVYHLEASIAYWHTTADENRWSRILDLYNQLLITAYSPVAALNRSFAFAKVHGAEKAIVEAEKLGLTDNGYYHGLMGYLYTGIDTSQAVAHYQEAVSLSRSVTERNVLLKKIEEITCG